MAWQDARPRPKPKQKHMRVFVLEIVMQKADSMTLNDQLTLLFHFCTSDNPSQVSRVLVAIETLDLNDNAPELDRQYTTAMCDSTSTGQVS